VQTLIDMGVDVVYPVELPPQSNLNLDGQNSFEPIVCKLFHPETAHQQHLLLSKSPTFLQTTNSRNASPNSFVSSKSQKCIR